MEISRRGFVSAGLGAAAATIAAGLIPSAAIAETADGSLIYEGYAEGFRGGVTVHVTLKDNAIQKVDIVKCTDCPSAESQWPCDLIPQRIVDAQSTDVDAVTGATFTSNAIMLATQTALEAAGVADQFTADGHHVPEGEEDIETDILIMGAGVGGVTAAMFAKGTYIGGLQNNLKVTLIDRQGFVAGNSILSDGSLVCSADLDDCSAFEADFENYIQPENGTYFPCGNDPTQINAELAYKDVVVGADTIKQLHAAGFPIQTFNVLQRGSYTLFPYIGFVSNYTFKNASFEGGKWPFSSDKYGLFLRELLDMTDIDVRLETEGQSLLVEDGKVVGAHVSSRDGEYDIRAKKVIIATGGIDRNKDLLEKYSPECAKMTPYVSASNLGMGLQMAVDQCNAAVCGNSEFGGLGQEFRYGMFNNLGSEFTHNNTVVLLNMEGERYCYDVNVANDYPHRGEQLVTTSQQTDSVAYAIFDSDNTAHIAVDAVDGDDSLPHIHECIFKADTLEELFDAVGLDTATAVKTIDTYNGYVDAGEGDPDFGCPASLMLPVKTAPFYAVRTEAFSYGSCVALKVTGNCEVVNSDGDVVPNLFAVGQMAWTGAYVWWMGHAIPSGRVAGETARNAVLEEQGWQPATSGNLAPSFASGQEELEAATKGGSAISGSASAVSGSAVSTSASVAN